MFGEGAKARILELIGLELSEHSQARDMSIMSDQMRIPGVWAWMRRNRKEKNKGRLPKQL